MSALTEQVECNVALNLLSTDLVQRVVDAECWNRWARAVNDRAVVAGLASEEEVAQGRAQAEEALARLRSRIV